MGRLNACANSVYQVLLRFSCVPGMRLSWVVMSLNSRKVDSLTLTEEVQHGDVTAGV